MHDAGDCQLWASWSGSAFRRRCRHLCQLAPLPGSAWLARGRAHRAAHSRRYPGLGFWVSLWGAGHVAIIVDVKQPDTSGQGGYVRFAQANAASAIAQEPLFIASNGQLHMQTWTGYTVLGYIRHTASVS